MKLDIHAHILPERWDRLKEKYGYGGFIELDHYTTGRAKMMRDDGVFFREIEENCWNPLLILDDMDKNGVDVMTLCTVPVLFNYWAEAEHGMDWSQFLNNHLADVQRAFPKRFIALGTVPMQNVDLAISEMTRCVRELRMPGLEIGSNILGKNLDDQSFFPFYEAAEELGACLLIHPWEMAGADRMKRYFMEWLVGMPAETTLALCSMLFGGVFDRFPNLKVLFSHASGAFPFTLGRIAHGYNVRPDLCNVNNVANPREYIGKFWVDGITHDNDAFRYLLNLIGPDKICYGTDYPFPLGDLEHGKFLDGMSDISTSDKQKILSGSALEFLGLKADQFVR
ncbi:MAG: amidohydrolase [Ignavibacteriae bacterium]|nr:amidohydrolase [Ignavibacteriota bacterium]